MRVDFKTIWFDFKTYCDSKNCYVTVNITKKERKSQESNNYNSLLLYMLFLYNVDYTND